MADGSRVGRSLILCCAILAQTGASQETRQYVRDATGQLIGVVAPDGSSIVYEYDATGNRLVRNVTPAAPNTVTAILPVSVAPGYSGPAAIVGNGLSTATGVTFSNGSITATLNGAPTTSTAAINLTVGAGVAPGPYTFTVARSAGGSIASGAVVLTVTALPALSSISPNSVFQGQTVPVWTLNGARLTGATAVQLDDSGYTVDQLAVNGGGTSMTARLKVATNALAGANGQTGVRVKTPAGLSNRVYLNVSKISPGLQAAYYDKFASFDGGNLPAFPPALTVPAIIRVDADVRNGTDSAFNWHPCSGTNPNICPGPDFTVRWHGAINLTQIGSHTFAVRSSNASRLTINGQDVVLDPGAHAPTTVTGAFNAPVAGLYPIVLTFNTSHLTPGIDLSYQPPGAGSLTLVPASVLFHAADFDGDGIPDDWELANGLNPTDATDANADPDGDGRTNKQEYQSGTNPSKNDVTAPAVSFTLPANAATGVPLNSLAAVCFGEPMTASSFAGANLQLMQGPNALPATVSAAGACAAVKPSAPLTASTVYTLRVSGARDLAGNAMAATFTSTFTTGSGTDSSAPTILFFDPDNNSTDVPTSVKPMAEFSEAMNPVALSAGMPVIVSPPFATVPGTIQVSSDGKRATFTPASALAAGRNHSLNPDYALVSDMCGNLVVYAGGLSFYTSFAADASAPTVVGISPAAAQTSVPTNPKIVVDFSDAIDEIGLAPQVALTAGGPPIAVTLALSNGSKRLTVTPNASLAASTLHTLTLTGVKNLSGVAMAAPFVSTFTTGSGTDVTGPTVTLFDPTNQQLGVPTNLIARAVFSEVVNRLSVTSAGFYLYDANVGKLIPTTLVLAADGKSATVTPLSPLLPFTYYEHGFFGLTDLAGNAQFGTGTNRFTTGGGTDAVAPAVTKVSPANAATGVAVNAKVTIQLGEPIDATTVSSSSLTLTGGGAVAGSLSVSADSTQITFTPTSNLAVSTVFTVNASGFKDLAGNTVTAFSSSFTTAASATPDTTSPGVSISPLNGATGVGTSTAVVWTLTEPVNPTSVSPVGVYLYIPGVNGRAPGTLSSAGNQVTFTPSVPYPFNTTFNVVLGSPVADFAGNVAFLSTSFTTAAGTDSTAPTVTSVVPPNASTNQVLFVPITLTFSEAMNPTTLHGGSLAIFGNGQLLSSLIGVAPDNLSVTITPYNPLPPGTLVTVTANGNAKDLAGNALVDFASTLTSGAAVDPVAPQIVGYRPENGAVDVDIAAPVVVFTNEALDASSLAGNVVISENGVAKAGTLTLTGGGGAIQFVPSTPWTKGVFVQVFVGADVKDAGGNRLGPFGAGSSSFTVVATASAVGASVLRYTPALNLTSVPRNVVLQIKYSEPLDPASVNGTNVKLFRDGFGEVTSTVSVVGGDTIQIAPSAALVASAAHSVAIGSIRDADGGSSAGFTNYFTTAAGTDGTPPTVALVSPSNGSTAVATNSQVRVSFSEAINPLTVSGSTISVTDGVNPVVPLVTQFANFNKEVVITPQKALSPSAVYNVSITNVKDEGGNNVTPFASSFTTGTSNDTTPPALVRTDPNQGLTNVAMNSPIALEFNEPLNPISVNGTSVGVTDNGAPKAGTVELAGGGRIVTFVPGAPYAASHTIQLGYGVTDLSGNFAAGAISFTTGASSDAVAPTVLGTGPANGQTGIPRNARLVIDFSEPIQDIGLASQITLAGGGAIPVTLALSNADRRVTVTPMNPLAASAAHTLTISGVKDLAGNTLAAPVNVGFTTSAGVDLVGPSVTSSNPAADATGVAKTTTIVVNFSEKVNLRTVDATTFFLQQGATPVATTLNVAADGLSATLTPTSQLAGSTQYNFTATAGITDLAGNALGGTVRSFTTAP